MALGGIAFAPTSTEDFFLWAHAHAAHHYDCVQRAESISAIRFDNYVLDPFNPHEDDGMETWLEQHQQMHMQMNNALNISSYDLTELDWKDVDSVETWFLQHYSEHEFWGRVLKVG